VEIPPKPCHQHKDTLQALGFVLRPFCFSFSFVDYVVKAVGVKCMSILSRIVKNKNSFSEKGI
jgi:hypothetical protein